MAKEILKEEGAFYFPALTVSVSGNDDSGHTHKEESVVAEPVRMTFDRVELERRIDDIRPDIIAYVDNMPMLIEVAVTSFVTNEKRRRIRRKGLAAVEINLRGISYAVTKQELREILLSESPKAAWISNPLAIAAKSALRSTLAKRIGRANRRLSSSPRLTRFPKRRPARRSPGPRIHATDSPDKTRWFRCDSCTSLFEISVPSLSSSAPAVTCPDCGVPVSTHKPRSRRR